MKNPGIGELRVRLLYPFALPNLNLSDAVSALTRMEDRWVKRGEERERRRPVWVACASPGVMRLELLPHVERFLFGQGPRSCRYLRVAAETADRWFGRGMCVLYRKERFRVTMGGAHGIELFLSPYGFGVLSIRVSIDHPPTDPNEAAHRVYRMTQMLEKKAPMFFRAGGEDGADGADGSRADALARPLWDRLGMVGAPFRLTELIGLLLNLPDARATADQSAEQLTSFSVVRFDAGLDLTEERPAEGARMLAKLAQGEEADHPGPPHGDLGIPNAVLNVKHWAAVSYLGAAHLVADQDFGPEFDSQRVPLIIDKYFSPFLLSLLTRFSLHRLLDEAGGLLAAGDGGAGPQGRGEGESGLRGLRRELRELTVEGHFRQFSRRDAVNRFYDLCLRGQRLDRTLDTVRQGLADLNADNEERYRRETADALNQNLRRVAAVQNKVEWLEIFFVSFYGAKLAEIMGHAFHFPALYTAWSTLVWALVAGLIAAYMLTPWTHGELGRDISRLERISEMVRVLLRKAWLPMALVLVWFASGWLGTVRTAAPPDPVTAESLWTLEAAVDRHRVRVAATELVAHPSIEEASLLVREHLDTAAEYKRLAEYSVASAALNEALSEYQRVLDLSASAQEALAARALLQPGLPAHRQTLEIGQRLFDAGRFGEALDAWSSVPVGGPETAPGGEAPRDSLDLAPSPRADGGGS